MQVGCRVHEHGVRSQDNDLMSTKRTFLAVKSALRQNALVGIVRQMHFGIAFYVVDKNRVCATPCQRKPESGDITATMYEEWYDMVPDGNAIIIYNQSYYGFIPWNLILRRLKERRLVA